jgi:hypothetical protein
MGIAICRPLNLNREFAFRLLSHIMNLMVFGLIPPLYPLLASPIMNQFGLPPLYPLLALAMELLLAVVLFAVGIVAVGIVAVGITSPAISSGENDEGGPGICSWILQDIR